MGGSGDIPFGLRFPRGAPPPGEWTPAERAVIEWQFGLGGAFFAALWDAILRADEINLRRLALGFPTEVEGFRMWRDGNLAERLRKAGLTV